MTGVQTCALPIDGAALLHDCGKWLEYSGEFQDHAEASAQLAEEILLEVGFHPQVTQEIVKAVANHRTSGNEGLSAILYQADKLSRPCFVCPVREKCKWEKKNEELVY